VGRVGLDALAGVGRRASRSRKHLETSTETTLLSKLQLPAVGHSIIFSFSARRSETQSGQIQAREIIVGPRSAHAPYFQDIEASYSCNFMVSPRPYPQSTVESSTHSPTDPTIHPTTHIQSPWLQMRTFAYFPAHICHRPKILGVSCILPNLPSNQLSPLLSSKNAIINGDLNVIYKAPRLRCNY
jgi:hypothetical protein